MPVYSLHCHLKFQTKGTVYFLKILIFNLNHEMHLFQMKMIFFIFCDALEARRITYHATHGMHATPMACPDEEL